MNIRLIHLAQGELGLCHLQKLINTGLAWRLEGSYGRQAMECLREGSCYLPLKSFTDLYGNKIPSRRELVDGEIGTLTHCKNFYEQL